MADSPTQIDYANRLAQIKEQARAKGQAQEQEQAGTSSVGASGLGKSLAGVSQLLVKKPGLKIGLAVAGMLAPLIPMILVTIFVLFLMTIFFVEPSIIFSFL